METTGLEELLEKILNTHVNNIERFENEANGLRNTVRFCSEHKFEEEKRMALIKLGQMEMLLFEYKTMFNDVNEALQNWKS